MHNVQMSVIPSVKDSHHTRIISRCKMMILEERHAQKEESQSSEDDIQAWEPASKKSRSETVGFIKYINVLNHESSGILGCVLDLPEFHTGSRREFYLNIHWESSGSNEKREFLKDDRGGVYHALSVGAVKLDVNDLLNKEQLKMSFDKLGEFENFVAGQAACPFLPFCLKKVICISTKPCPQYSGKLNLLLVSSI